MLVSIHKQYLMLICLLLGVYESQAQVWTLQQCIDTAQNNNKSLQINRNNVEIGEQRIAEARPI